MAKLGRYLIIALTLFIVAGCNNGGSGTGGSGVEAGVTEGPSGTYTEQCLKIVWQADTGEDHGVVVELYLNNQWLSARGLSLRDHVWYLDYSSGGSSIKGYLAFSPGFETIPSEVVAIDVTLVCAGKTYTINETVASW